MGDWGEGVGRLLRPTLLNSWKSLLTINLVRFETRPKLFSTRSLSQNGSAILDFTTFYKTLENCEKKILLTVFIFLDLSVEQ